MQSPKFAVDALMRINELERHELRASHQAYAPRIIRQKVMPGETSIDARARWRREEALEHDRDMERRRVFTGQVLPIGLEDE